MTHRRPLQNVTHLIALATLVTQIFPVFPAQAAQSDWIVSQGGDVRLVAEPPLADGTIPAILEIRLVPGWKTYWLNPGASGIPPQVTVEPSSGISFFGMRFPAPRTFDDGVVRYTGYDKPVAFPLLLKREAADGDIILKASVFLGICKDICIPVQGDLSLDLKRGMAENPLDKARIDAAMAALPAPPSDAFKVLSANYDPGAKRVRIALVVPGDASSVTPEFYLAGPPGYSFGSPQNIETKEGRTIADIPVTAPAKGGTLKSGSVLLVARAGALSMETPLAFD